jgi:hypothetical protein
VAKIESSCLKVLLVEDDDDDHFLFQELLDEIEGLAVCTKIAERHGGSITAQSIPGQGATFIVTLPIQQSEIGNPACQVAEAPS